MKSLFPIGLVALLSIACGSTPPAPETAAPSPAQPSPTPIAQAPSTTLIEATVVSVGDGDTFRAQVGAQIVTIRMACIDAPETAQPQGQESATRLQVLLPREAAIQLHTIDTDRYGRMVAEVYQGNTLINLAMVQEGRAVVYYEYLDGCSQNRDRYIAAETAAKDQRLAFWSQDNPILPWDWRSGSRPTSSPEPAQPVATSTSRRTAFLRSTEPGSRINLRSQPSTVGTTSRYGLDGDRVSILEEAQGNDGYTWYRVEFPNSGAIGWIRGDFISDTPPSSRPTNTPQSAAPVQSQPQANNCDPSYPGVCIPPAPPDLDCGDISYRRFAVRSPDPHGFDGDQDGIGCES